jgi:hypothetical protein
MKNELKIKIISSIGAGILSSVLLGISMSLGANSALVVVIAYVLGKNSSLIEEQISKRLK